MHGARAAERHAYMYALPVHAWSTAHRQAQPHALTHAVDHPAAHLMLAVGEALCNGGWCNHVECPGRGVARTSRVERGAQGAASVTSAAIVAPLQGLTAGCSVSSRRHGSFLVGQASCGYLETVACESDLEPATFSQYQLRAHPKQWHTDRASMVVVMVVVARMLANLLYGVEIVWESECVWVSAWGGGAAWKVALEVSCGR